MSKEPKEEPKEPEEPKEDTKPEEPKEEPKENTPTTDLIDKAKEQADRIEEANKKMEENIKKLETLKVRDLLGGQTEAGTVPKEETPEEYKNRIMKGEYKNDEGKYA
jgi:hypothetical protein